MDILSRYSMKMDDARRISSQTVKPRDLLSPVLLLFLVPLVIFIILPSKSSKTVETYWWVFVATFRWAGAFFAQLAGVYIDVNDVNMLPSTIANVFPFLAIAVPIYVALAKRPTLKTRAAWLAFVWSVLLIEVVGAGLISLIVLFPD